MSFRGGTREASPSHTVATATGAGSTVDLDRVYANPVGQIATNGAVTGGVIVLEGSLDSATWYTIATSAALGAADVVLTAAIPARFLRTNITTTVTGGTVSSKVGAA